MNTRLKTSKNTDIKLEEMHKTLRFSSKAVLARIAIGISLQQKGDPRLQDKHRVKDVSGFEFGRNTLTGDLDDIYKILVIEHLGKRISEEEYFPLLLNAHIERGTNIMYSEFKLRSNKQNFIKYLLGVI